MNKLVLIALCLAGTAALCVHQRAALDQMRQRTALLRPLLESLRKEQLALEVRHQDLQRALAGAQSRQKAPASETPSSPSALAEAVVPPDPAVGGGWPSGKSYFYLPKRVLASIGITGGLCQGNRLTDYTAVLFGITPAEREAVDAALDTLWNNFRALEIQGMEPTECPERFNWPVTNAVAYRIPALTNEMPALRAEFDAAVQSALGSTRAELLRPAFDEHFQENLNNLGASTRIVAFARNLENGYPVEMVFDETRKVGDAHLMDPLNVPRSPDAPTCYYARLLGIELPKPAEPEP